MRFLFLAVIAFGFSHTQVISRMTCEPLSSLRDDLPTSLNHVAKKDSKQIFHPPRNETSSNDHKPLASWNGNNGFAPWPNACIPYVLDDTFPTFMQDRIRNAMDVLSSRTCLTFVDIERSNPTTNATATSYSIRSYLREIRAKQVEGSSSPSSPSDKVRAPLSFPQHFLAVLYYPRMDFFCASLGIGMHSSGSLKDGEIDPNVMFLSLGCDAATVVHELLHVAGFDHEMTRIDRDAFVSVDEIPVYQPERYQYEKRDNSRDLFAYDHYSIMHYGDNAVRYRGKPIMSAPVEVVDHSYLRASDQAAVNFVYGCALKRRRSTEWVHQLNPPLRCVSSVSAPHTSSSETRKVYLRPGVPFPITFSAMKSENTPTEDFTYTVRPPSMKGSEESFEDVVRLTVREEKHERSALAKFFSFFFGAGEEPARFIGSSVTVELHYLSPSIFARLLSKQKSYANRTLSMGVEFSLRSTGEKVRSEVTIELVDESAGAAPICFGSKGREGCNLHGECRSYKGDPQRYSYCVCDDGWKGAQCQIALAEQCSGSYAIRFNKDVDTDILFPPSNATGARQTRASKSLLNSLRFAENIASPFSRSTLEGRRGGMRVASNLTVHLRSLVNKRESPKRRVSPGRITLSMILPLGMSETEIQLFSSRKARHKFRIPISQRAMHTRDFPFIETQESLPEANAYTFFDIAPNYDRGDLSVRINGDVAWMTIFNDENTHFRAHGTEPFSEHDGASLEEIDTVRIEHRASAESGPCYLEEITMECRVSIQPRLTLRKEVVVHDEKQSFLLTAPNPETSSPDQRIAVVGVLPEKHADSIISYEGGRFAVSKIPDHRSNDYERATTKEIDLTYAMSSTVVDATIDGSKVGPQSEMNHMMVFLNTNLLERHDLAAPIVFANRVGQHRGHGYTFDMSTESQTCFLADLAKGSYVTRAIVTGSETVESALTIQRSPEVYMELLPTPIRASNIVTFSFRIPGGKFSKESRNVHLSHMDALQAKSFFTFSWTQHGRGTNYDTREVRVSLADSRNVQVLYLRKGDGIFAVHDVLHGGLLLTWENQPWDYVVDGEWHTVMVEAGESPSDEATITVYRNADRKVLMKTPIAYATRSNGFLCDIRSFAVTTPGSAVEISAIHFNHASRSERVTHVFPVQSSSEIEAVVEGTRTFHDGVYEVNSPGEHAFEIHSGSSPFVRVSDTEDLERAVPAFDGVYAQSVPNDETVCRVLGGHRVCTKRRIPEVVCYVEPTREVLPYSVRGHLVCVNSTKLRRWLGTESLQAAGVKMSIEDSESYLRGAPANLPRKALKIFFKRHLREVEAERHAVSKANATLFLELPTGVRELTAEGTIRRLREYAAVRSTMLGERDVFSESHTATSKGVWGFFKSFFGGQSGKQALPAKEAIDARWKARGMAFPNVAVRTFFASTWWDAVDDYQFLQREVLPVMQSVAERARGLQWISKEMESACTGLRKSLDSFEKVLEVEHERLTKGKLLRKANMKGLSVEQQALLVEHSRFLDGVQQHSGTSALLVDLSTSFHGNTDDDLLPFLAAATETRSPSTSPDEAKRNMEFVASALAELCEWNRLVFRFWDSWTEAPRRRRYRF